MSLRAREQAKAKAFLEAHTAEIKPFLKKVKAEDPEMYKVLVGVDDMLRISALGDFYTMGTKPATAQGRARKPETVEDQELLAQAQALNNGTIGIDENTSAEVFRLAQELQPKVIGLNKIPQAKNITEASKLALGINVLANRKITDTEITPKPAINLSVENRAADADLMNSLLRQKMLMSGEPLYNLKSAGDHGYKRDRREAGTGDDIQRVLIGDMVRGFNPITGVPYGPAFIENGKLVRDQIQGGHVRESNLNESRRHDPTNIIGELSQENYAKASRGKETGPDFTDEQAMFNTVDTVINEPGDSNMQQFKQNMRAIAEDESLTLQSKIDVLLSQVEAVEAMTQTERNRRRYRNNSDWSNLSL